MNQPNQAFVIDKYDYDQYRKNLQWGDLREPCQMGFIKYI